jgi:hypothetical protein
VPGRSEGRSVVAIKGKVMTLGKQTDGLPEDLEAALNKVRAAAPAPQSDDPIYKYLRRVYRLRRKVKTLPEMQRALKAYHKEHYPKTRKEYTGVIIEMTAGDHVTRNMKYKYFTALAYAYKKKIRPNDFIDFLHKCGGLNKCGELWRKEYGRRTAKRRLRNKRGSN